MKRIVWILPLILLVTWAFWRNHQFSRFKFLHGNSIVLIDHLQNDFIVQSQLTTPLKSIHAEKLINGWEKVASFNSATVWITNSENLIVETANTKDAQLFCYGIELQRDKNLFRTDVQPNHWTFDRDEILFTTRAQEHPQEANCLLDYQTYSKSQKEKVTEKDLKHPYVCNFNNKNFLIFALAHPLLRSSLPDTSLRRDGKTLASSEWRYSFPPPVILFQSSVLGVFKMFGVSDVLTKNFYVRGGLANFSITANADLAGPELPLIGIYIDRKKVGELEIKSAENERYSLMLPIPEGNHLFELKFENDFYDQKTRADRNIGIQKVELEYQPAVIVPWTQADESKVFSIDYWKSSSDAHLYYSNFILERARNNEWINPISTGIVRHDELRRSLILGSGDKIQFPIEVPKSGLLEFGHALRSAHSGEAVKLKITSHRAFHLPVTLFSKELIPGDDWTEEKISLSSFSGEKILLTVENNSSNGESPTLLFISNPTIVSGERKNPRLILIFSFDALRADHLGVYGYHRNTSPNIDAFAKGSVLFENAYTAATWTLPSFASVFSSLNPSFHNVKQFNESLDPSIETLPEFLHDNGFHTGAFINNPFLHPLYGFSQGFDTYNFHITDIDERVHSAINWLDSSESEKRFLFVHVMNPHTPYTAPPKYVQQLMPDAIGTFDSAAYRRVMNRDHCAPVDPNDLNEVLLQYDAEIRQADDLFQSLLTKIKESGLYDNSMIIVMSDHGEEFLDHGVLWHGPNVFPATARVPLIIKFPAKFSKAGIRIRNRVHLIDLMPTILEVTGIHQPAEIQGKSLLSLPAGDKFLFTENRKGMIGIMNERYHYVFSSDEAIVWTCPPAKTEELYDLVADPQEKNDISSLHMDLLQLFRKQKESYLERGAEFRKTKLTKKPREVELDLELKEQMRALGYIQ